jgi:hypothetical protein
MNMADHNPDIKSLLIKSIDQATKINPDKNTTPAQTLDEYYEFVTWDPAIHRYYHDTSKESRIRHANSNG